MTILLSFAALLVLALFLAHKGIQSAVAPLAAVCITALWFVAGGCFGVLRAAGWVYFIAVAALAVLLVLQLLRQKQPLPHLGPGFWFFVAAGAGIILLFWVRQPMFLTWDEFSTWGTSAKLVKLYNQLYTTAPIGWGWDATHPPVLACFTYFMQFFAGSFSEWQTYAAYNILQFACIGALLLPFEKKSLTIAFPALVISLLTPFIMTHYGTPQKVSAVYLDSLADVPLAFLFAAALAVYFGAEKHGIKQMLPLYLALAALALTKDHIGLAMGLVAAVLVLADLLFAAPLKQVPGLRKRAPGALGRFGACIASVVAPYIGWQAYLSVAISRSPFQTGGAANVSLAQMPVHFFTQLFARQQSEKFAFVTGEMMRRLLFSRVTLLGSGAMVLALCLVLLGVAAVITKSKTLRRRSVLFGVFALLGFVVYYTFIMMSYLYLFSSSQAMELASYERYVYPYYIAFFLVAVLLLGAAARNSRFVVEGKAAVLLLCALLCFRFWQTIPPVYSVLGFHTSEFAARREFAAEVDTLTAQLPEDSLTFVVSTDDDGLKWFMYCYEFLPWQVDYSYGGGSVDGHFVTRDKLPDGTVEETLVSPQNWAAHLLQTGSTHILVDYADEAFRENYGLLFEDDMQAYFEGNSALYTVEAQGETVLLRPIA